MFYTEQLNAHRTKKNGERKYSVAFYEFNEETRVYEFIHIACVNSEGAHLAIAFDNSTNNFVLNSIKPL